jgi:hypothetical protein
MTNHKIKTGDKIMKKITSLLIIGAALVSTSAFAGVSTKIDNVTWVVKGMCGTKAAKSFRAGEERDICRFAKSGWVDCRTKTGSVINYMPYFTRTSDTTASLELTEYRGATGAPDMSIELERCSSGKP